VQRLLGFVALVCVWVYFCCNVGCLCQGLQGLWLFKVGWSAGGECVVGRDSLVIGWGRMREESVGSGERVDGKGRKRGREGEQCILSQEKEGE
jgi:hypothetical protein